MIIVTLFHLIMTALKDTYDSDNDSMKLQWDLPDNAARIYGHEVVFGGLSGSVIYGIQIESWSTVLERIKSFNTAR